MKREANDFPLYAKHQSTFDFTVPFLSVLAMVVLLLASVLLFFVPLRWLILVWGVNKFTKKLRSPNAIDNNELMDFLSRVPDMDEKAGDTHSLCDTACSPRRLL